MWRILGSLGIVVAALLMFPMVLMFVVRLRSRMDFNYAMRLLAKRAVLLGRREHGVTLDYSPGSIERVENILGGLHNQQVENAMSDRELSILSARWGAYIGEVMKRVRPAKWRRDSEVSGAGTMPLIFDAGSEAYPRSWVYKRIVDGPEDNVVFKFQTFQDPQLRRHLSGGHVDKSKE